LKARLEGALFVWEQRMADIPEAAQRARQMYADGVPVAAILAETKLTLHGFYNWINGRASAKAQPVLLPMPKRRLVRHLRINPGDRRSLIERMMRSAERQVAEIELRVGSPRHDREKDARMLAVLARAIRELTAVDSLNHELEREAGKNRAANDDPVPEDMDEFRNELARRLEAVIAARAPERSAGTAESEMD
jgi:hypothetical protein